MIKANVKREMTNANILVEEAIKKVEMRECAKSFVDEIFQVCEQAIENARTEYSVSVPLYYGELTYNRPYSREEKMNITMNAGEMVAERIAEYGYHCSVVRYTSKNTFKAGCIIINW